MIELMMVICAQVDATANDLPKAIEVKGFPTLLLFAGDGTAPQAYEGGRDFKSLADFVTKKTGAAIKLGVCVCVCVRARARACACVCVTDARHHRPHPPQKASSRASRRSRACH